MAGAIGMSAATGVGGRLKGGSTGASTRSPGPPQQLGASGCAVLLALLFVFTKTIQPD